MRGGVCQLLAPRGAHMRKDAREVFFFYLIEIFTHSAVERERERERGRALSCERERNTVLFFKHGTRAVMRALSASFSWQKNLPPFVPTPTFHLRSPRMDVQLTNDQDSESWACVVCRDNSESAAFSWQCVCVKASSSPRMGFGWWFASGLCSLNTGLVFSRNGAMRLLCWSVLLLIQWILRKVWSSFLWV